MSSATSTNQFYTPPSDRHQRRIAHRESLQRQGVLPSPQRLLVTTPKAKTNNKKGASGRIATERLRRCIDNRQKTFYLIRHGESLGQATKNRRQRETDPQLLDCGLTFRGRVEAQTRVAAQLGQDKMSKIELVVSSPLTRALETACRAFPDTPILVHYHLRELGSPIPENQPRCMSRVLRDLQQQQDDNGDSYLLPTSNIDTETLRPDVWPPVHDCVPKVLRRDRVADSLYWLARERPERVLAVVCHYHVIRAALRDSVDTKPANCEVFELTMDMETGAIERRG